MKIPNYTKIRQEQIIISFIMVSCQRDAIENLSQGGISSLYGISSICVNGPFLSFTNQSLKAYSDVPNFRPVFRVIYDVFEASVLQENCHFVRDVQEGTWH